jgi:hypothetical protein
VEKEAEATLVTATGTAIDELKDEAHHVHF